MRAQGNQGSCPHSHSPGTPPLTLWSQLTVDEEGRVTLFGCERQNLWCILHELNANTHHFFLDLSVSDVGDGLVQFDWKEYDNYHYYYLSTWAVPGERNHRLDSLTSFFSQRSVGVGVTISSWWYIIKRARMIQKRHVLLSRSDMHARITTSVSTNKGRYRLWARATLANLRIKGLFLIVDAAQMYS